jgi:hypothetical protein
MLELPMLPYLSPIYDVHHTVARLSKDCFNVAYRSRDLVEFYKY